MSRIMVSVSVLVAFLGFAGFANADQFKAKLSGEQEVPSVVTDSNGKFKIKFKKDATAARFELTVKKGVRVTQAHIHCAPAGANGPVVAFLAGFHPSGWDVDGKWISHASLTDQNIVLGATPSPTCPEDIDTLADLVEAIRNGNAYVNVHTLANPGGEVRGQLAK